MIGIIPTDTIYGLVGPALSKKEVERIYKVKKRGTKKPFIILISSIKDLELFKIKIDKDAENILKKLWPGKVSVILPCPYKKFEYLHRGTKNLAFRLPRKKQLIKFIRKYGPLVAPSANPEGLPPANSIREAKEYFGDRIDFYISGSINDKPSTI